MFLVTRHREADPTRRIDDPQVDAAIAHVLRHDSDPMVKSSALFALRYRDLTPETLSALLHVVKTEPDKTRAPRRSEWRNVRRHLARASDLIKWVSVNDPDEDVRRLAAQRSRPTRSTARRRAPP